ncbi:MAG: TolC family protein [Algoriphagus sp.]|jgi:outer membrane protein TolC|nr:TolC family protein [Algoriphagus sp.]
MRNALLIFLILCLPLTSAIGQSEELKTTAVSSMVDFDLSQDIALQLPSLEELSNIALEYSPKIKKNINLSQAEREKIFLQRRTWAQHIQAFVNASSGNQGILITGIEGNNFNQIVNGYRYGINLNLPVYEIMSRGPRVKLAEYESKAAENIIDEMKLLVEEEVSRAYFQLITAQKIMISNTNFLELATNSMVLSEKKLLDNQTTFSEHTRITEIKTLAEERFNRSYAEFLSSFRSLEILVGIKLSLLKN